MHTCVALAQAGHDVLILDNLCNSRADVVDRFSKNSGWRPAFIEGDCRDAALLDDIFDCHSIKAVMHFAGLKAVGESVAMPMEYYDSNIHGTLQTLVAMRRGQVKTFVYRSQLFGARNGKGLRAGQRYGNSLQDCAAPRRGYCPVLG